MKKMILLYIKTWLGGLTRTRVDPTWKWSHSRLTTSKMTWAETRSSSHEYPLHAAVSIGYLIIATLVYNLSYGWSCFSGLQCGGCVLIPDVTSSNPFLDVLADCVSENCCKCVIMVCLFERRCSTKPCLHFPVEKFPHVGFHGHQWLWGTVKVWNDFNFQCDACSVDLSPIQRCW